MLQPALIACVPCLGGAGPPTAVHREPGVAASGDNRVGHRCADGSPVGMLHASGKAEVHWAGGRTLMLPRAESASRGGGDAYVGDTMSLQHDDDELQLHDGPAPALACEQT
jgi:hypothetical protein